MITLKIRAEEDAVVLSVQNPVAKMPKKRGATYLSDKLDRENHGLGLLSIRTTAEKYNGEVLAECENNEFTLLVRLHFAEKNS